MGFWYLFVKNDEIIKRDLLKQRHAKITERFKVRRFGVILTPLSREKNQFVNADI